MDRQQISKANALHVDSPQAGITANFLVMASLLSVVVVTVLVCSFAAGILMLFR